MTTPNSVNRLEEGDDPSGLLRDSKVENPATDQEPLTASQKHHGVGHALPTLPEGLPLNSTHNKARSNASSSRPPVSWRANALANASPAGAVNDLETDLDGDKVGRGRCRRSPCCDLPPAAVRVLSCIYEKTAGPLAHVLFWLLIYVNLLIFTGKEALPPTCFEYKRNAAAAAHAGLSAAKKAKPVAFCEGGKTLNILIFYAFATVVGVVTELMRLPGLVGMLLSGLALHCVAVFSTKYDIMPGPAPSVGGANYEAVTANQSMHNPLVTFASLLIVDKAISARLRQIALATILTRAGLSLDPAVVKRVVGGVARMALIPCLIEALSTMVISKYLLNWPWAWAAMLGFVLAAISPAVVVPNMMRLQVAGLGVKHGIPTITMAACSMDDVVSITGFGVAFSVAFSEGSIAAAVGKGPAEALGGAAVGLCLGFLLWFLPPPGMEHGNVLRGSCLILAAVAVIVGTVMLNMPGAGALACLIFSFSVSIGWQGGWPWRLMRQKPEEEEEEAEQLPAAVPDQFDITSRLSGNSRQDLPADGGEREYEDYYRQHLRRLRRSVEHDRGNALAAVSREHRRFSLVEPMPAYETEEFASRRRHTDYSGGARNSLPTEPQDYRNRSRGASRASSAAAAAAAATALADTIITARERGMSCMQTMRSFMATVWWFLQPLLFSLIGADVAVEKMRGDVVGLGIAVIICAVIIRLFATFLAMTPSQLTYRERVYVALAWMPKATVQAAIGGLALEAARKTGKAELIDRGEQILTLAALIIILTAPLAAMLGVLTAPCLLTEDRDQQEGDKASGADEAADRGDADDSETDSAADPPPPLI